VFATTAKNIEIVGGDTLGTADRAILPVWVRLDGGLDGLDGGGEIDVKDLFLGHGELLVGAVFLCVEGSGGVGSLGGCSG
jgi:hypothetical protein